MFYKGSEFMKRYLLYFLCFFLCVALTPTVFALMPEGLKPKERETVAEVSDNSLPHVDTGNSVSTIKVKLTDDDAVITVGLEDYVTGVLFTEIPSNAPNELIKTMAIVIRTYAVYHAKLGDKGHSGFDFCDDFTHCRGFTSSEIDDEVIKKAVADTKGLVICYNGEVIDPVVHISSSGKTESAENVFGKKIPYLVSVDTPDEAEMPSFRQQKELTKDEFAAILSANGFDINKSTSHTGWISYIARTPGGRIKIAYIGGHEISGAKFATMFGLQSTNITISTGENGFILNAVGIGHGVGLSIYGGWVMAKEGKKYSEIIVHYFSGAYIAYN